MWQPSGRVSVSSPSHSWSTLERGPARGCDCVSWAAPCVLCAPWLAWQLLLWHLGARSAGSWRSDTPVSAHISLAAVVAPIDTDTLTGLQSRWSLLRSLPVPVLSCTKRVRRRLHGHLSTVLPVVTPSFREVLTSLYDCVRAALFPSRFGLLVLVCGSMLSTRIASQRLTRPRFKLGLSSRDSQVSSKRARPT